MNSDFENCLRQRTLVLDGATGTLLSAYGAPCTDLLCLDRPELVRDAHLRYISAGSDIITTNTFNANPLSLSCINHSGKWSEICREAVALARQATGASARSCFVAGCMGACAVKASQSRATLTEAYRLQAQVLIDSGADLLMLESVYDLDSTIASAEGIRRAISDCRSDIPLMLSATITRQGLMPSGHSLEEFVSTTSRFGANVYGLNCGFGLEAMLPYIRRLAALTPAFISFHPNAGLPDADGHYAVSPARFANLMQKALAENRINIIGGCCGTTPEYIRQLRNIIDAV